MLQLPPAARLGLQGSAGQGCWTAMQVLLQGRGDWVSSCPCRTRLADPTSAAAVQASVAEGRARAESTLRVLVGKGAACHPQPQWVQPAHQASGIPHPTIATRRVLREHLCSEHLCIQQSPHLSDASVCVMAAQNSHIKGIHTINFTV